MQTPTTSDQRPATNDPIRSSVLFPMAVGTYWALALEDLAAPGKSYVASIATDADAAFALARDVAKRGHCRAHVFEFCIAPGGHIEIAPGRDASTTTGGSPANTTGGSPANTTGGSPGNTKHGE